MEKTRKDDIDGSPRCAREVTTGQPVQSYLLIHMTETQKLLPPSRSVRHHGVAPAQVQVYSGGFWRSSFDECTPSLLRCRVSDAQYAATIHGLNDIFRLSVWSIGVWLGVFGIVAGVIPLSIGVILPDNDFRQTTLLYGLVIVCISLALTIVCSPIDLVQVPPLSLI
jgi:hypothetical protein